jgi:hypothetical protein
MKEVRTNVSDYHSIVKGSAVNGASTEVTVSDPILSGSLMGSYFARGVKKEC